MTKPPPHPAASPGDSTTLIAVLAGYAEAGFTSSFSTVEPATVRCETCGAELSPTLMRVLSMRRLEGASDPDDMLAVAALRCPACDAAGTLVMGYGPASSSEDSDVLVALGDGREDDELPAAGPPSEDRTAQQ